VRVIFPELNGSGFGIDVRSSYLDGFELGLNNRQHRLFLEGDELWLAASTGVALRERLDTYRLYAESAKTAVVARYDFPTCSRGCAPTSGCRANGSPGSAATSASSATTR